MKIHVSATRSRVKRLRESIDESRHGWNPPPNAPALDEGEVHVWRIPLRLPDPMLGWADAMLDEAERAMAARFRFSRDRVRFVVGRAIQRDVLARYLRVGPADVRYRENAGGKLELAVADGAPDLRFNFSNSAGLGLLAIAASRAVGIDVERLRPMPDAVQLTADWLSPRERAVLEAAALPDREMIFFRFWTYKEAYIKALGWTSASFDIDYEDVAFAPWDETASLLGIGPRLGSPAAARWKLEAVAPPAGYVGALAVEGQAWTRSQFEWQAWTRSQFEWELPENPFARP